MLQCVYLECRLLDRPADTEDVDALSPLADTLPEGLGEEWPDFEEEGVARERDFHQVL